MTQEEYDKQVGARLFINPMKNNWEYVSVLYETWGKLCDIAGVLKPEDSQVKEDKSQVIQQLVAKINQLVADNQVKDLINA